MWKILSLAIEQFFFALNIDKLLNVLKSSPSDYNLEDYLNDKNISS